MSKLLEINREAVLKIYDKDDTKIRADLDMLKTWLTTQPHLPPIDDKRMENMLLRSKFSLESCKQVINAFYTYRSVFNEILKEKDPLRADLQTFFKYVTVAPIKTQTANYERVIVFKTVDPDVTKYNSILHYLYILMVEEICLRDDYSYGVHYIIDMEFYGLSHVLKFQPAEMLKLHNAMIKGYKIKMNGIHIINPSKGLTVLLALFKGVMSEKIYGRIKVHNNNESLQEIISKELLPKEYGGFNKSLLDISAEWVKELEDNRDWFLRDGSICTDESKRPEKLNDDFFGSIHGSFKTLAVD